jgi:hypothetical protein
MFKVQMCNEIQQESRFSKKERAIGANNLQSRYKNNLWVNKHMQKERD